MLYVYLLSQFFALIDIIFEMMLLELKKNVIM